jgi:N-acetylglutamate synthase-like GNAT family acetyltransferase
MREATRYDVPHLWEMAQQYAKESGVKAIHEKLNANHVQELFLQMINGKGFVLIDENFRGFLAAYISGNFWNPQIKELHEIAWWVTPEYRNSTIGGRLWLRFNQLAQYMLDSKRVDIVCTSLMPSSPDIDYTRYKYKPLQATFFRE